MFLRMPPHRRSLSGLGEITIPVLISEVYSAESQSAISSEEAGKLRLLASTRFDGAVGSPDQIILSNALRRISSVGSAQQAANQATVFKLMALFKQFRSDLTSGSDSSSAPSTTPVKKEGTAILRFDDPPSVSAEASPSSNSTAPTQNFFSSSSRSGGFFSKPLKQQSQPDQAATQGAAKSAGGAGLTEAQQKFMLSLAIGQGQQKQQSGLSTSQAVGLALAGAVGLGILVLAYRR